MTETILDKIKAYKLEEIATRKAAVSLAKVEAAARDAGPLRGFANSLKQAAQSGYALIAEVKKASPSKVSFGRISIPRNWPVPMRKAGRPAYQF